MPRQKPRRHMYSVHMNAYASEEIKRAVESGTTHISGPDMLSRRLFYLDSSKAAAERAFARAAMEAYSNPLAFQVTMGCDGVVLTRLKVEHR